MSSQNTIFVCRFFINKLDTIVPIITYVLVIEYQMFRELAKFKGKSALTPDCQDVWTKNPSESPALNIICNHTSLRVSHNIIKRTFGCDVENISHLHITGCNLKKFSGKLFGNLVTGRLVGSFQVTGRQMRPVTDENPTEPFEITACVYDDYFITHLRFSGLM